MIIVAAIHGILTGQTTATWPARFEAWMMGRDARVHVITKEYKAGPWPRWNNYVKDPGLAEALSEEIQLAVEANTPSVSADHMDEINKLLEPKERITPENPHPGPLPLGKGEGEPSVRSPQHEIWLVAHSNGAVIALLLLHKLIAAGVQVAGIILTGAAVEADIALNGVFAAMDKGQLGAAIAYSSHDDCVVDGDASQVSGFFGRLKAWCWGRLMWPYGSLGRTGWLLDGRAAPYPVTLGGNNAMGGTRTSCAAFTRWYPGGHSCYFIGNQMEKTFEQFYTDIGNFGGRVEENSKFKIQTSSKLQTTNFK